MTRTLKAFWMTIAVVAFSFSCSEKEEVIRIGAVLPLTGSAAELAGQHRRGLEFGIEQINKSQEFRPYRFELVLDDDQNDPKNTVSAVRKQITVDKVDAIITVMSGASMATAPITESEGILHIANCGHPAVTREHSNVFRNFPSTVQEVDRMAEFIHNTLRLTDVSLLYIDDAYGKGAEVEVVRVFPEYEIQVQRTEAYGKAVTDARAAVLRVLNNNPPAVYVYGYGQATAEVVNRLSELKYKGIVLGSYNFSQPPLTTVSEEAIIGSYYTVPTFDRSGRMGVEEFWDAYVATFNSEPLWNGVVEYDAVHILATAVLNAPIYKGDLILALKNIGDYQGIGGVYRFLPSKDWIAPMSIAQVTEDGIVYVK